MLKYNPEERFSLELQFDDSKFLAKQYKLYLKENQNQEETDDINSPTKNDAFVKNMISSNSEALNLETRRTNINENKNLVTFKAVLYNKYYYLFTSQVYNVFFIMISIERIPTYAKYVQRSMLTI